MSLNLGTLTGFLDLDASKFDAGLDDAAGKMEGFGGKGARIAATAGLAIGAALAGGVLGGMNVEAANDKLAAQLGLNAKESERIGKVAGDLYAGAYGESLSHVNEAVAAVMTSIEGMSSASSADLKAVTTNALDFATAMNVDVSEAARSAGILVQNGLAANATNAFDLLTVAAQKAGPAMVQPVMEAANEYGTYFSAMGFSGEEAMGVLVAASAGGEIALDKAGDAVKEFGIRATDLGDTGAQEALAAIGLSGTDMATALLAGGETASTAMETIVTGLQTVKDPAKQAELAVALFGTPIEDIGKDKIPKFLDSLVATGDGLGDVEGAAGELGTTLNDNASAFLVSFKREAEQAVIGLANGLLPAVNDTAAAAAENFGPALDTARDAAIAMYDEVVDASNWLREHETTTKVLAGVITTLMVPTLVGLAVSYATTATAAVVSGATQSAVWLRTQVQALATGVVLAATFALTVAGWITSAVTATASALTIAAAWLIALGPVGLVIAGIAAVVVIFVTAYKTSETFRDVVIGAFSKILGGVSALLGGVEKMLRALGKVPGFGWADTAADKIAGARSSVDGLNTSLGQVKSKTVTVTVNYNENHGGLTPRQADRLAGTRAAGGPVAAFRSYLIEGVPA